MDDILFTKITAKNCDLTKRYKRTSTGELDSTAIAHMTEGRAEIIRLTDICELDVILRNLQPNEAITCGVPSVGDTPLTTRAGAEFRPDAVARTNEAFAWHYGPSLFPIDVDVEQGRFQSVGAVLDALESCHPWLKHLTRFARPSSSSYVEDRGLRGVHAYFAITRGTDIPNMALRMQAEQWAAGRGSIKISKSGALLVRQVSDDLVYQPSRLMFEAAPVCEDGVKRVVPLEQTCLTRADRPLGAPMRGRTPEGALDAAALPPLKDIEYRRFETRKRQARDAKRSEAKSIAIDYQKTNAIASGYDTKEGERFGLMATRALGDKLLPTAWQIHIKDVGPVSVQQILDDLPNSLNQQCADPFDTWRPDLQPKHFTKAEIIMLGDKPGVWSHKLQQFFAFTQESRASLAQPIEQAAEKFCGLIEYPEKMAKTASLANVKHALSVLLREIQCVPRLNVATGYVDRDDCPSMSALIDALTRVGCSNVSRGVIDSALDALGETNQYDPWKDAILALPQWDKTPRLDTVFEDVCGTFPHEAVTLTARTFFAGLVMRQLRPGAGAPIVPVLIGRQGFGKSRFVAGIAAALGAPAPSTITFTDSRTMSMRAARSVVAELAEMSGMGKRDIDEIKAWVSDCVDAYRRPYDREEKEHPRRFMPVGNANIHELNRDASGNRRLMPIEVNQPIEQTWTIELPQILAEARARFCVNTEDYSALLREASDAVFDFNQQAMLTGIGVPASTLDDLLPPIIEVQLNGNTKRRVYSGDVRRALDLVASGRNIGGREVAQWFVRRGWTRGEDGRGRFYGAPASYQTTESDAENSSISPFA